MAHRTQALRLGLEALRARYDQPGALAADPISAVLAYRDPGDRELAAWVAAHLAYGRVAPMLGAIRRALEPLGPQPASWLRSRSRAAASRDLAKALRDWVWRFHTAPDLVAWILAWKDLEAGGGLERHFIPAAGESADWALSRMIHQLRAGLPGSYGTRFTLPDPLAGAACKRWRMFLRWMVRPGWPDLGLWRSLDPAELRIPLDTHVARVSRFLGLTRRTTADGRMAAEITEALRSLDPRDPLKYDFALSHLGILGDCPGVRTLPACGACPLVDLCRAGD
ncbi:MAG: TIGR02757 family protein [Acidobacteria bacterium]|nr:TIGR02757 family protein [Acidobacteriota bacterium]